MSTHSETRVLPYPPERFFDLVADVESYPEFLPFWRDAKVYRRVGQVYYTDQEVGIGPVRERFRSKTVLERPTRIDILSSERMFRKFAIHWEFTPISSGGCQVQFTFCVEARSRLLGKVMDALILETARGMVAAFERRARERFGALPG